MSGAAPAGGIPADQSMEDILASIRRILNDEDKPAEAPATSTGEAPVTAAPPSAVSDPETDDTLLLTEDMMVAPPPAMEAPPPAPAPAPPPPAAAPVPDSLLAPAVAAAATASVSRLLNTVASERGAAITRGGPSIEDVVREEIRPLLKSWLDQHLPGIVERLVRAEIERLVGRALS
jgi:cell pole-organizing protein PopZ